MLKVSRKEGDKLGGDFTHFPTWLSAGLLSHKICVSNFLKLFRYFRGAYNGVELPPNSELRKISFVRVSVLGVFWYCGFACRCLFFLLWSSDSPQSSGTKSWQSSSPPASESLKASPEGMKRKMGAPAIEIRVMTRSAEDIWAA
jgi:hypothetical protein